MKINSLPEKNNLYDPANEHDSCGVGFVVNINNRKSHAIVNNGLQILKRLHHRGAVGADPKAGDGAGILTQIPDEFFRAVLSFALPQAGTYGVGMIFLPKDEKLGAAYRGLVNEIISKEGQELLGWRSVPVDNSDLGVAIKPTEPEIAQVFVRAASGLEQQEFERKLFVIHKQISALATERNYKSSKYFYISSFSSRTIVYKGMLLADQVGNYYLDLQDERFSSALALVHQRFSTNTFPTWDLAQPFRMIAHNGEINTIRGNTNWIAARRHSMKSRYLGDELARVWPVIPDGQSDSACFDNGLELLTANGYSLAHAIMTMIPEAWNDNVLMDAKRRDFYRYHASMMEPWDGPAAVAFTDGVQIGATLDRNGLRPARYLVTDDGMVIMASEMGVLDIPQEKIVKKWRLEPGKMLLIDLQEQRIIDDNEIKRTLAGAHPYDEYIRNSQIDINSLPAKPPVCREYENDSLLKVKQSFGLSREDISILLKPMITAGQEGTGSMGNDIPPAVLSNRAAHLSYYFKQNFAQVTNPPIDPIREELVMSLTTFIGPKANILDYSHSVPHLTLASSQPVLSNEQLEAIRQVNDHGDIDFKSKTLDITFMAARGNSALESSLESICSDAENAVNNRYNILILSDRAVGKDRVAIPALLAVSAVHHHLIHKGLRTETGLVVETGSALEIHHFATLAGYGAEAINPWLAFDIIDQEAPKLGLSCENAHANYIQAVGKGLKKVMSKMGISTYQSYCGAQIFDAVGLSQKFVERYFTGTASMIGGIGINEVAKEALMRHEQAYGGNLLYRHMLDAGGLYAFRTRGEKHVWTPGSISKLRHAVRSKSYETYAEFSEMVNRQDKEFYTLRGLMDIKYAAEEIPLVEVEPAKNIVTRFATGAMSFGSISDEAHSTLAIALNSFGGKSNSGEGGEEPERYLPLENGESNPRRSAIKQVASGRFGVTTEYLVNADKLQIKMAQGAKPGEGGQLPGHKVDVRIAKVRHSTPGVGLISPPPHHDIYSIEDLAQLIHDLKNANPYASVSVKLVAEVGVGTVAAGVSKAKADHITISGYDGGTGASPLTSIKHAGSPWEIGLAETQQALVANRLRSRIKLQVDGGMRTGRDVIIAAILGADQYGFATAPLIAEGCIMMRKCHLNTCPVGIATQDKELRKKFTGKPEHVINYFFFVAEEARKIMAKMGVRKLNDIIGQSDLLSLRQDISHWKARGLDYDKILYKPAAEKTEYYLTSSQNHGLDRALDNKLIKLAQAALDDREKKVSIDIDIYNYNRTLGTMLSGEIARRYGHEGLSNDTININAKGVAGQSLGAWLAKGVTIKLAGEANDYVGKGMSGGKIIVYPPENSGIDDPRANIIVGNTVLFGAIAGEAYFSGVAGERFCVRNSGAHAVVEGVGDHGCEYMTGGVVVCLGSTGRNFAAGMSGGIAYVFDEQGDFADKVNHGMVELETVSPSIGREDLDDMLLADEARLKTMISRHARYTGSDVARKVLDNWDENLSRFIKVMPLDYRRALSELKTKAAA